MHPTTWVVWTLVVATVATLTRNPMYLSILLGTVVVNHLSVSRRHPDAQGWRALMRIVLGLTILVIPFNALNFHTGSHILFRLPSNWPLVGGNITLEAVISGAGNALSLATLMLLFATFNLAVNQAQLLRLTPAFLYEAGLIISIALTFIPQMMVSAREIREAQLIRGHRMRRARDMLPFLMALLTTGLERSFQLAESMEARGFGNVRALPRGRDLLYKTLTLVGLAGFLSGFFVLTYLDSKRTFGWAGVILSATLLLGTFWAQGRRVSRTHYRRDRWTWRDGVVLGVCLAVATILVLLRMRDATALFYYPTTALLPPFYPWLGAALTALVAPAVVQARQAAL